jgi:hypothetical protein
MESTGVYRIPVYEPAAHIGANFAHQPQAGMGPMRQLLCGKGLVSSEFLLKRQQVLGTIVTAAGGEVACQRTTCTMLRPAGTGFLSAGIVAEVAS